MSQLRTYRIKHKWSQEEVARRIDVSQSAVSRWERGERPLPKHARRLGKLFRVPPAEFLKEGKTANDFNS